MLPVLARRDLAAFRDLALVWGTVPIANWIGCVLIALGGFDHVIGGTGLFALLAHAQVKDEV